MGIKPWTEGRHKSFITTTLRSGMRRYPPKYECLNNAFTEKKINPKTGRMAKHYRCNICKEEFTQSNVNVDHTEPAVDPKVGFVDWNTFIERLFCSVDNLQCLCIECHRIKTKSERTK